MRLNDSEPNTSTVLVIKIERYYEIYSININLIFVPIPFKLKRGHLGRALEQITGFHNSSKSNSFVNNQVTDFN